MNQKSQIAVNLNVWKISSFSGSLGTEEVILYFICLFIYSLKCMFICFWYMLKSSHNLSSVYKFYITVFFWNFQSHSKGKRKLQWAIIYIYLDSPIVNILSLYQYFENKLKESWFFIQKYFRKHLKKIRYLPQHHLNSNTISIK